MMTFISMENLLPMIGKKYTRAVGQEENEVMDGVFRPLEMALNVRGFGRMTSFMEEVSAIHQMAIFF